MRIDGVNNNMNNADSVRMGMQTRMAQGMNAASRNIQNQIQAKQQELQKLSENEDMSLEDKMKKRQEIQKEISELNMQLRQHQMEQRREQQQSKGSSVDDMLGGKQQAQKKSQNGQSTGFSQAGMTALISADSSIKQAKVQGSAATKMEGRANILKAEIKQSGSTEAKEAELAGLEQKAVNATASQMNTLAEANNAASKAAAAERTDKKDFDTKEAKASDDTEAEGRTEKAADSGAKGEKTQNGVSGADAPAAAYTHVDIRL